VYVIQRYFMQLSRRCIEEKIDFWSFGNKVSGKHTLDLWEKRGLINFRT